LACKQRWNLLATYVTRTKSYTIIISPKTIVFGRTYVLLQMFSFLFQHEISQMRRPIGAKFCTMIKTRLNFIMPVQNFGGPPLKTILGAKTCKIWRNFGRL